MKLEADGVGGGYGPDASPDRPDKIGMADFIKGVGAYPGHKESDEVPRTGRSPIKRYMDNRKPKMKKT